jgi:hypothetical protein
VSFPFHFLHDKRPPIDLTTAPRWQRWFFYVLIGVGTILMVCIMVLVCFRLFGSHPRRP